MSADQSISAKAHLFRSLLVREIRAQYLESIGGLLWTLVLPLVQLAIYAFVFTKIFQVRLPEANLTGFVPFLAVAMWPWNAFAESLTRATSAITENEALIGKVALPKEVLVAAAATAPFVINLLGYAGVLVVLLLTGTALKLTGLLVLLPLLLALYLLTLGAAFFTSATQVFIRDLRHVLMALLMMWFFATPIIYGLAMVPEQYHVWYQLNPFTHIVGLLRAALLPGQDAISWFAMAGVMLLPLLLVWLGYRYFQRLSVRFEDFL